MESVQKQLAYTQQAMEKVYKHTQQAFTKINAGRATPTMLEGLLVTYYGSAVPIHQVASVSTPDARTLLIKPWEKQMIPTIEKAILESQLAWVPQNDGEVVRINIPPLTEERRKGLVKQVRAEAEKGRVGIRNVRKETKEVLKKLQKEGASEDAIKKGEEDAQTLTDQHIASIEQLLASKETELMKV